MTRFPGQPADVPWPTDEWVVRPPGPAVDADRLAALLDRTFTSPELAATRAVVVVHRGAVVAERYGEATTADTPLRSWSVAKSVLATLVGVLVAEGRLDLDAPAGVPEWSAVDDPRRGITLRHLLQMRPGLAWREDYVDGRASDVIAMLFGAGADDVAAFAASKPLAAAPGSTLCYSSGTSNIVSRLVAQAVGGPGAFEAWAREVLLDRIGMASASFGFDAAGTWVGSSYLWATARDWARFGLLNLRGGAWGDDRVVPEEWVSFEATASGTDEDGDVHGAHWWVLPQLPGAFTAVGYEHQYVRVVPSRDLVLVRLGKTPTDQRPLVRRWLDKVTDCVVDD